MERTYRIAAEPYIIPTNDGKIIEEFFGNVSINAGGLSFAHMIAPGGWSEPYQTPEFDEITYIIKGKKQIEINGEIIVLEKNRSICVFKGYRVRYSNPFNEPVEYISVCIPAFTLEKSHREK